MPLTLVIANKAYSSWSLRPWLAMKVAGIPFEEVVIPLRQDDTKARILEHSPAGKVPVLKDGSIVVWESLAILDYLAEHYPHCGLWPSNPVARANARSVAAEMHGNFQGVRGHYPMNVRRSYPGYAPTEDSGRDTARIEALWADARGRFGQGGPFLFGEFTAADAMYAPIVTRFVTYDVKVSDESRAYMQAILDLPAMQQWYREAKEEAWVVPAFEFE